LPVIPIRTGPRSLARRFSSFSESGEAFALRATTSLIIGAILELAKSDGKDAER